MRFTDYYKHYTKGVIVKGFCLEVSGDFACFTRPEMKVERVSYDVITPSAARAIFEAILWKPAIRWRVTRIDLLNPIRWVSIKRNEVGKLAGKSSNGIYIEDARQQRAGLFLRDVKYRLYGEFDFISVDMSANESQQDTPPDETEAKYASMFERRANKGQCFNQPYLGCREFSCDFRLIGHDESDSMLISESRDLGWMLYDIDFSNPEDSNPMWFRPKMKEGSIAIPHPDSEEVLK